MTRRKPVPVPESLRPHCPCERPKWKARIGKFGAYFRCGSCDATVNAYKYVCTETTMTVAHDLSDIFRVMRKDPRTDEAVSVARTNAVNHAQAVASNTLHRYSHKRMKAPTMRLIDGVWRL